MKTIRISLVTLILALVAFQLQAQVTATPSIIFIDKNSNSGTLTLENNGEMDKEIELFFKFGYATIDTNLQVKIRYDDSINAEKYDIGRHIKLFPSKLILKAKTQQTVRLLVIKANALADGAYWSRIVVRSKDVQKQIDSTTITDEISARFVLVTETANIVFFHKGKTEMGLEFGNYKIVEDSVKYAFVLESKRIGNSPFLGGVEVRFLNNNQSEIFKTTTRIANYFDSPFIVNLPKEKVQPGNYELELTFTNVRDDVMPENRLPFKPLIKNYKFSIK